MTGLKVRDVSDTIPDRIFDELFGSQRPLPSAPRRVAAERRGGASPRALPTPLSLGRNRAAASAACELWFWKQFVAITGAPRVVLLHHRARCRRYLFRSATMESV
jgi:hypothetical protein